jgi:hypothetical protein
MKLSEKQAQWINQLEELWNFLDARLKSYKMKTHDLRLIVLLHMTVAAHRLIRGFLAQLKGGSNDNLQSNLRTLTEATINANYILADETDNRAKAFILDSTRSRIKVLERIINLLEQDRVPSMARVNSIENYRGMKSRLEQELFEQQNLLGRSNITWPTLEQRAKRGDSEELYATVFGYFSQDTHMTADSIDRFISEVNAGSVFTAELDLSALNQEIQTAFAYYLIFITICSEKLGFPAQEELKEFTHSDIVSTGPSVMEETTQP